MLDLALAQDQETLWVVFSTYTPDTDFGEVDNCPDPENSCPTDLACDCPECWGPCKPPAHPDDLCKVCPEKFSSNPCVDVYRIQIDL